MGQLMPPQREPPKLKNLSADELRTLANVAEHATQRGVLSPDMLRTEGAVIRDLARTLQSYDLQKQLYAFDGEYPVVLMGADWVPLDMFGSSGVSLEQAKDGYAPSWPEVLAATDAAELEVQFASRNIVDNLFADSLSNHLKLRIEAVRGVFGSGAAGAATGATPGLAVTVHSRTPNIKIVYSTALLMNASGGSSNAFGSTLSTPVSSYLPPGQYYFGGTGAGISGTVWETTAETIPPNLTVTTVKV